jgi:hypothetical protein
MDECRLNTQIMSEPVEMPAATTDVQGKCFFCQSQYCRKVMTVHELREGLVIGKSPWLMPQAAGVSFAA